MMQPQGLHFVMDELIKWNLIKISLSNEKVTRLLFPHEGEVWMCSLGQNLGYEQNGAGHSFSRPALVIKKFNNKMFWAIPLSTKQKSLDFYFNFTDPDNQKVSAIMAQMKLISVIRFRRKLYEIDSAQLAEIKNKCINLLL